MPENLSLHGCGDLVSKSMCSLVWVESPAGFVMQSRLRKWQQHPLFTSALAAFGEAPAYPQSLGAAPLWDLCSLLLLLCK